TPSVVRALVEQARADGFHGHNTRNTGYANCLAALEAGARVLDASVGGLGGCPFSPRATGNVATEDLAYLLEGEGIETGIDLVGLAWRRLHGVLRLLGVAAIALCAVVYFAVHQSKLDAKPLNAVPALGLALAVALVLAVGVPPARRTVRGDRVRIALASVGVFFAAPLIAAELGFFLDDVPFLGWFFETERLTRQPG